jgi:hypothetical protein
MDARGHGSELGGGDAVEAMYSVVWGIDQVSFRLTRTTRIDVLWRGELSRVRETKRCRKIDMVLLNDVT